MGVKINNSVELNYYNDYLLLEGLREFVSQTENMGDKTKVRVTLHSGQRDPYVKLSATYGDIEK